MRLRAAGIVLLLALVVASLAAAPEDLPPLRAERGRSWRGRWIWTSGDRAPRNAYVYFRKTLDLETAPRTARLSITADSRYQLYVNGTLVGRGPARSDRRWLYYDTWDVASRLRKGRNVLAVLVHHYGEFTFQYMKGRGGLIADLVGPAGITLASTDDTWRVRRSEAWQTGQPRMSIQLGFNEIYDARKEPRSPSGASWQDPTFDDAGWERAIEIGPAGMGPWPRLVPRDIPPMREEPMPAQRVLEVAEGEPPAGEIPHVSQFMATGERRPLRDCSVEGAERVIQQTGRGARVRTAGEKRVSFLIDFGREVTGYPRFRVRGARGGEIVEMGYGEVLQDPRGGFVPQNADPPVLGVPPYGEIPPPEARARLNPDRDNVHYADRYICRPGDQTFQTFDKRAFRYLQIDVRRAPEGVELDSVGLIFSTYPVAYRGAFECSDERLNRIWEIGRYTCQLNMEDGYTDCPWRERGQWWGDARVEALINYYCFGDTKLIRKALRQKAQSLNQEGMTWGVYPTDWDGGRLPSFTLIWVSTLWETYRYTGDREIVAELAPRVRYTLDRFFAPRVGERGLLRNVPYWVFIDWAPVDAAGESGALNAYYYDALRSAAAMGRLLGESWAAEYERRAAAVKEAMLRHLWDAEQGLFRDSILPDGRLSPRISQQTNSLCVLFDIAPGERHAAILDRLYAPENRGRWVEAGSPYFSYYQLAAMFHAGQHDRALAYIRERWGRMLDWGATTWWEMWNPGASFCHGWSGGPTFNLGAEVLGVRPLEPGFREVLVAPHWGDLTYATGVVPTVRGDVRVAWQREPRSGTVALRVETPAGVPAELLLPATGDVRVNRKARLPSDIVRLGAPRGSTRLRLVRGAPALVEIRPAR